MPTPCWMILSISASCWIATIIESVALVQREPPATPSLAFRRLADHRLEESCVIWYTWWVISVYRAITGPYRGDGIFSGVSAEQLEESGICCSNDSLAQSSKFGGFDEARAVNGLPVFLSRNSAVGWLRNKKFRSPDNLGKGLGVLACAEIDERLITSRRVRIIRNAFSALQYDQELTLGELTAHRDGRAQITSECYIPDFPMGAERPPSTFLIPRAHTLDGRIDLSLRPTFIDIAELA